MIAYAIERFPTIPVSARRPDTDLAGLYKIRTTPIAEVVYFFRFSVEVVVWQTALPWVCNVFDINEMILLIKV